MQNNHAFSLNRRSFLQQGLALAGLAGAGLATSVQAGKDKDLFNISLAQWSLHRTIRANKMNTLAFPAFTKRHFGIDAVEYVNQFFLDKAKDTVFLRELKKRSDDVGVKNLLIMCDREGKIGEADKSARKLTVENHKKWVDAARFLGCHSIRVNAYSIDDYEEAKRLVIDGLRQLTEYAAKQEIYVLVENHGGLSSNGKWLASVIRGVDHPNCGTLPDFGNFTGYDRYQGVAELMLYAKGVSAKSRRFDTKGEEIESSYLKMLKIVLDAGYRGYIGIEYEGKDLPEIEGIRLTQQLLSKYRSELAKKYTVKK